MSKDNTPTPDSGTRFPKTFSLARNRALKRGALWTGGICVTAFGLILLFGGLAGSSQGFTTTVDRASTDHMVLRTTAVAEQDKDGVYYLHADGLTNAKPTTASAVLDFCKGLYDVENLGGQYVMEKDAVQYAFAYTFYLENTSEEEQQIFTFYISLDAYSAPSNLGANNPFSYLRVLVYANVEGTGTHQHTFYAALNDQGQGTVDGGKEDLRECLAEFDTELQPDGTQLRYPVRVPEGEDGYCVGFSTDKNMILSQKDMTIEPKQTLRYTIVTYFEGEDPDCAKSAPDGASITLSAHFGRD